MVRLLRAAALAAIGVVVAIGLAGAQPVDDLTELSQALESRTVDSRIVGGSLSPDGRWPQTASLQVSINYGAWLPMCGATVVSPTNALTAAHCFFYNAKGRWFSLAPSSQIRWSLVVGSNDRRTGTRIPVNGVEVHENYQYQSVGAGYDIAIATLSQSTTQPPSILATANADSLRATGGSKATVVGWGATRSNGSDSSVLLRQTDLQMVDITTCRSSWESIGLGVPLGATCAISPTISSASCSGDSGGPLFVPDGQGRSLQTGLVSFGLSQGGLPACLSVHPTVYTQVSSFQSWIQARVPDAIWASPYQSGWYAAPNGGGQAYLIELRGNQVFAAALTYRNDGSAAWYVATGALSGPSRFSGSLRQFQGGQTLGGAYAAPTEIQPPGTMVIEFTSATTADIAINGVGYSTSRFSFIPNGVAIGTADNLPETGWYVDAAGSGAAYFVELQGTTAVASSLVYTAGGPSIWYLLNAPGIAANPPASNFVAPDITCVNGSTNGAPARTPLCPPSGGANVGNATFAFDNPFTGAIQQPNGTRVTLNRLRF